MWSVSYGLHWAFIDIIGCGSAIQASLIAFALHDDSARIGRGNGLGEKGSLAYWDHSLDLYYSKILCTFAATYSPRFPLEQRAQGELFLFIYVYAPDSIHQNHQDFWWTPDFVNASPKSIIAGWQGRICLILHWEQRALFFALRAVRPCAAYRGRHKNISYISNIRLTPCFFT